MKDSIPFRLEVQEAAKPRRRLSIVLDERDPFCITGPASVSFSGGRTSAYLLWRILHAHGGELPPDVVVLFANTGKERPETLDFVRDCAERWNVPVVWVERVPHDRTTPHRDRFRVVTHATASRAGEPFAELITERGFVPNPVTPFCTQELKVRVLKNYMRSLGCEWWDMVIGLRADERPRVRSAREAALRERWEVEVPLHDAGVTVADVAAFWRAQPFDLALKSYEGNCDLCFKKQLSKRLRLMVEGPERVAWWAAQEARTGTRFLGATKSRRGELSYAALADFARRQVHLPLIDDASDEGSISCVCTD